MSNPGPKWSPTCVTTQSWQHDVSGLKGPGNADDDLFLCLSDDDDTDSTPFGGDIRIQQHDVGISPEGDLEDQRNNQKLQYGPGSFREGAGHHENAATAFDSLSYSQTSEQDSDTPKTYLAVGEVVRVPELVNIPLGLQDHTVMSMVTTPPDPNRFRLSNKKQRDAEWMPQRRTLLIILLVLLLVLIGLVAGLVVSLNPSRNKVRSSANMTAPPTISPSTLEPTPSPTHPTVLPPSPSTASPTVAPTVPSTETPTVSPTIPATSSPTIAPTVPATASPTVAPTVTATDAPTVSPTAATQTTTNRPLLTTTTPPPTNSSIQELRQEGVRMLLTGISPLNGDSWRLWARETASFLIAEVQRVLRIQSTGSFSVEVNVVSGPETVLFDERLEMIFTVEFTIKSSLSFHDVESYVLGAFDSDAKRLAYMDELKATEDPAFANVTDIAVSV